MKRWHLYLDESGVFNAMNDDDKPERNVVGGFMLPENDGVLEHPHRQMVKQWVCKAEAEARAKFPKATDYNFGHCRENIGRWNQRIDIQPFLLNRYRDEILNMGGRIVIFDGGVGLADVDNTNTFLSVLSKGIIRLYHKLEKETPDNEVELITHCAKRVPHGDSTRTPIELSEYQRMMKHIAFLLCEYPTVADEENPFYRTVDAMKIMEREDNSLTTVCDYLCNTYQHVQLYGFDTEEWRKVYHETYEKEHCLIFDTMQSADIKMGDFRQMIRDRTYVPMLIRIINRKTSDEELINGFFMHLNRAPEFVQRMFVAELIERFSVETQSYYRDVYNDVVRQIEQITDLLNKHMANHTLLTELCANTNLFLLTMHTHRGQDEEVQRDMDNFERTIVNMQDDATAARLWEIYYNRLLVFQTDRFEFDKVDEGVVKLMQYWKKTFEAYCAFGEGKRQCTSSQYGKEIGSYLQMTRFQLRKYKMERNEDFTTLRDLVRDYWEDGRLHLTGAELSRMHQTMCDVETEIGDYKQAFQHLYAAAMLLQHDNRSLECHAPFSKQCISAVFEASWKDEMVNPFIYYHFVRLMNELAIIDDERAQKMLIYVPGCMPSTFERTMAVDMRIGIKWKLGSTYVRTGAEERGKLFLDDAVKDALGRKERAFDAIALAIACERASLGIDDGHEVPGIYEEFLRKTEKVGAQDPFTGVLPKNGNVPNQEVLFRASRMIAY